MSTTTHVSQSECNTAQDCGMRWFAQWHLGLHSTSPEGPAQRVGSLGHACLAAHVSTLLRPEVAVGPTDLYAAMLAEARKRRYIAEDADWCEASQDLLDHAHLAHQAAHTLVTSPEFDVRHPVVLSGVPLIEHRLHASWDLLRNVAGLCLPPAMLDVLRPHRLGMEGTPDIVHSESRHADSTIFLDDYKMRTRPVDGDSIGPPVPDPQGSFYKILLTALGADDGHRDIVFRQVNVYAGRWLTVDDFLEPGSGLVINSGLPTRNLKEMPGMVRAEVWHEAWQALEERRRLATADSKKGSQLPTETEYHNHNRFVEDLQRRKAVQVFSWRLEHNVCLEVVRDMLSAVAARLAQVDAGITPGRNLRTWPGAPCVRHFGCDVQSPCLAALGSNNAEATFREHLSAGRYHLNVMPAVGEHDGEEAA